MLDLLGISKTSTGVANGQQCFVNLENNCEFIKQIRMRLTLVNARWMLTEDTIGRISFIWMREVGLMMKKKPIRWVAVIGS